MEDTKYKEVIRKIKSKAGKIYLYSSLVPIREIKGERRVSKTGKVYISYYKKGSPNNYYTKRSSESFPCGMKIKKEILQRDNYKCVNCGETNDLHVHHKDGNGYHKARDKTDNSYDNLITLRRKCHLGISHNLRKSKRNSNLLNYHHENPDATYSQIARQFHLSRERVGQLLGRKNMKRLNGRKLDEETD